MKSQTPKFDKLLDEVLENLVPHEVKCLQKNISKYCEGIFKITNEDIEFYKKLRVPPPKCCPTCRRQRRFAFTNRIHLYKRKNGAPNGKTTVISFVPPVSKLKVWDLDYYRNGNWDPLEFGIDYEQNKNFFEEFLDLRLKVPQYAIIRHSSCINSEYTLNGKNLKNGYMTSGGTNSKDVWYSIFINDSREIIDCHQLFNCENCHDVVLGRQLNSCTACYLSSQCLNSLFLFDCRNCQDCLACVNLRNQKYCIFNEQHTKQAYLQKIKSFKLDTRSGRRDMKEKFWQFVKANPVLASTSINAVNCTGVGIENSKDCQFVTLVTDSVHERYVDMVTGHKDSMDVYTSGYSELMYETSACGGQCSNIKFSTGSKYSTNGEFLINCHNCDHCFACIGLENKSYCILNKQYEKDKYFEEVDRIKSSLLEREEYGEFFPYAFSAFSYNGSEAHLTYPLDKDEIEKLGSLYQEDISLDTEGIKIMEQNKVPEAIKDVTDDILSFALSCTVTGRPYRIIKNELEFYRKMSVPIPEVHPIKRMEKTFDYLGKSLSYRTKCQKCGIDICSMYDPDENWKLYCDSCYKKEVY